VRSYVLSSNVIYGGSMLKEKPELDEIETYKGTWGILVLTNKGGFWQPKIYQSKVSAEEGIERLKKYHEEQYNKFGNQMLKNNGVRDLIVKAYFALPR